jgi:hypothetical protein
MAYTFLWIDGFDEIGDASQKYAAGAEIISPSSQPTLVSGPFSYGRYLKFNTGGEVILQKAIPGSPYTVLFIGFHFLLSSTDTTERSFLQFLDAQNNVVQIELRRIWDNVLLKNVLRLYRGSTLLATTSDGIPQNTWIWLSVKHVCSTTNGVVEVKINNATVLSFTGNTQNGAATQVHRPVIRTAVAMYDPNYFWCDNLVIATGLASDPPLPECRIFGAVVPTSNDSIAFTPNAGTNWSNVNEIPPNDDTSYNYSNTVGATDVFVCAPPTLTGVIPVVKVNFRARKDDAGIRELVPIIRPGTTNHQGSVIEMISSYLNRGYMWTTNPDTGQAWNPGDIANLKFGYRIVT